MEYIAIIFILTLVAAVQTQDQIKFRFANYYDDHMILQRAPSSAIVWGYEPHCNPVSVKFNSATITARIESVPKESKKAKLPPTAKGGPYKITAVSEQEGVLEECSISDVLFGDVWMCGGQSNMVFTVSEAFNATSEIQASANYPNIRIMTVLRNSSSVALEEPPLSNPSWLIAGPGNIGTFSAVCWFFARDLYDQYSVPMGMISSNWGGTKIQLWSSPEAIKACTSLEDNPKPTQSSYLWNSMIYPFVKMTIFGAIWYQGEANSNPIEEARAYKCYFPAMINDWRNKWYEGTQQETDAIFPFGFVQLAADGSDNTTAGYFPELRWSQTADVGYVPNDILRKVFMAVAIDLGDPNSPHGSVHPRDKQDVGIRLSAAARSIAYNDRSVYYFNGPIPTGAELTDVGSTTAPITAKIVYGNIVGSLYCNSKYGFELSCVAGSTIATDQWLPGTVRAVRSNVIVDSVYVTFPQCSTGYHPGQYIRYAWRQNPCVFKHCAIYSTGTGYPFPSPPFLIAIYKLS